jgi:hypothetical protein
MPKKKNLDKDYIHKYINLKMDAGAAGCLVKLLFWTISNRSSREDDGDAD